MVGANRTIDDGKTVIEFCFCCLARLDVQSHRIEMGSSEKKIGEQIGNWMLLERWAVSCVSGLERRELIRNVGLSLWLEMVLSYSLLVALRLQSWNGIGISFCCLKSGSPYVFLVLETLHQNNLNHLHRSQCHPESHFSYLDL